MLAIEESQKLTLSNLPSLSLFTGTDQGQFEVMKSQVLKQIGYDSTLDSSSLQTCGTGVGQSSFLCG